MMVGFASGTMKLFRVALRFCSTSSAVKPRLRFAPSPTGYLHLGGLRTALYNYLMCRNIGGTFVLRIEDTDQSRTVPDAVENITKSLEWLGIPPDEGPSIGGKFGPYFQSGRLELYHKHAEELVQNGAAYRCFCSQVRLEILRRDAVKTGAVPRYDNRCRSLSSEEVSRRMSAGEQSVIRFKMDSPVCTFRDEVYGEVTLSAANEGDPVLLKSDGFPTYHLANVIDDHLMEITHVLRGVEWQVSTLKHLQLYSAFGWKPPRFAHLPLLLNSDGTKLSKRHGALGILEYREQGIYPEALLNLLVHVGGGFRSNIANNMDLVPIETLIRDFDLSRMNQNSCQISFSKLPEFNKKVIAKKLEDPEGKQGFLADVKRVVAEKYGLEPSDSTVLRVVQFAKDRMNSIPDLTSKDLEFAWMRRKPEVQWTADQIRTLNLLHDFFRLDHEGAGDQKSVSALIRGFCVEKNLSFKETMFLLRLALCGLTKGPSVGEIVELLGFWECCVRISLSLREHTSGGTISTITAAETQKKFPKQLKNVAS